MLAADFGSFESQPGAVLVQLFEDVSIETLVRDVASIEDVPRRGNSSRRASTLRPNVLFWEDLGSQRFLIQFDQTASVQSLVDWVSVSVFSRFAEPNFAYQIDAIPSDPRFPSLYGLHNTGQTGGEADADIDATEAWDLQTGSLSTIVGVIDTGVDYTHPDLYLNSWLNQNEIPADLGQQLLDVDGDELITFRDLNDSSNSNFVSDHNGNGYFDGGDLLADPRWTNGADDAGNGYIDDLLGWDFVGDDNNPIDDHNHGTHVAGTIGASANDSGIVGVNWQVQLMGLKFLARNGRGFTDDALLALEYAMENGADLTNNSWGGGGYSIAMEEALERVASEGQLFIAAAGNSGSDNDILPHYPSSYQVDNVISVAASDHNDQLAGFSNYGTNSVDLAAPGSRILSTIPGGGYATFNGTSMATPHVAGAAALLISEHPNVHFLAIREALLVSADPISTNERPTATRGRLNAESALEAFEDDTIPPAAVDDLSAVGTGLNEITLTWTATGDDGTRGTARLYDIRYSHSPIENLEDFENAIEIHGELPPAESGTVESLVVTELAHSSQFYFAMRVLDNFGNASPLSNSSPGSTWTAQFLLDRDFENGLGNWTTGGLWHITNRRSNSASQSAYFGREESGDYSTGSRVRGALTSPVVDLRDSTDAILRYAEWIEVESDPFYDQPKLQIAVDGGSWNSLLEDKGTPDWQRRSLDLTDYLGSQIQLRWYFDSIDGASNNFEGWYVDDIQLLAAGVQPGVIVVPRTTLEVDEGGVSSNFRVTLASPPTRPVSVEVTLSDPTEGTLSHDFINFNSENWDQPQTVTVTGTDDPEGDNFVDGDIEFRIEFFINSEDLTYHGFEVDDVLVVNRDLDTLPGLTVFPTTISEGDVGTRNSSFEVNLEESRDYDIVVRYQTIPASASANEDFLATSGTLLFPAGTTELTQVVKVPVVGDATDEDDEVFWLQLFEPQNASLITDRAHATIIDDDDVPILSVSDASARESDSGGLMFEFQLSEASGRETSVRYQAVSVTATEGVDFETTNGRLVIPAGDTSGQISVRLIDDQSDEFLERLTLELADPTNVGLERSAASGEILDNDETPLVTVADAAIEEGDSGERTLKFDVFVSQASEKPISFDFATLSATAESGVDFEGLQGTVNIAPGIDNTSILVDVFGDRNVEPDEAFLISLTNPVHAALSRSQSNGIIVNDDFPEGDSKLHFLVEESRGNWKKVRLPENYESMIVVGTANYSPDVVASVVRIRNANRNSFEFLLQNTIDNKAEAGIPVHFVVIEEGVYSDIGGLAVEAHQLDVYRNDRRAAWNGQRVAYENEYETPVVLGQVMSSNDPQWSSFWASGHIHTQAPHPTALTIGKHVGEDFERGVKPETIGYIVIEAGSGVEGDLQFSAGVGGDIIQGMDSRPPYSYEVPLVDAQFGILSQAGMDGPDGSWPVLYGETPLADSNLYIALDEDQVFDKERRTGTEQVAYFVASRSHSQFRDSQSVREEPKSRHELQSAVTPIERLGTLDEHVVDHLLWNQAGNLTQWDQPLPRTVEPKAKNPKGPELFPDQLRAKNDIPSTHDQPEADEKEELEPSQAQSNARILLPFVATK